MCECECVYVCVCYLQVSVYNAHLVQIVNSVQDLPDQRARIFLRIETFFHDSVEQFAAGHPAEQDRACVSVDVLKTPAQIVTHAHAHTHTHTHTHGSNW